MHHRYKNRLVEELYDLMLSDVLLLCLQTNFMAQQLVKRFQQGMLEVEDVEDKLKHSLNDQLMQSMKTEIFHEFEINVTKEEVFFCC